MRYRPLDLNGDYTVGIAFLSNSPACVGQAILTRVKLWLTEWFLDQSDGTPWDQSILGKRNDGLPDAAIKERILGTPGVTSISKYVSTFDSTSRAWSVACTANTIYGATTVVIPIIVIPNPPVNITTDAGLNLQTDSGINITKDP